MLTRKMKDSGIEWIGEIPEDWEVRRIGNYFIQLKDKNEELIEDNLLSLSYGNIIRKNINTSDGLLPENFSGYNIVNKNDIVLRMTDLQNDKRSLRTGLVTERGIITSAYITLRKKELQLINPRYIYFLLHAFDINKGFYGMGSGVRQNVNFNDIKKMNIIYPSIDKQERIVNKIESALYYADKIIEKSKQSIEELKKYKQSLITEAVTKGLDPNVEMKDSGIEWIGKIPKNWIVIKINRLFNYFGSGTTPQSGNSIYHENGEIPWLNTGDLKDSKNIEISKKVTKKAIMDYSALKIHPKGSIVVAMYGATIGKIGITNIEFTTNQACCVLNEPNINTDIQFVFYFLLGFKNQLIEQAKGAGQPNISQETLKQFRVSLPTQSEQRQIVSYLDEQTSRIDKLIADKTKVIEELEDYKKSLIYEYVTGKKEV